jgi:glycosyltransferase involved in cell wall biosynthesis
MEYLDELSETASIVHEISASELLWQSEKAAVQAQVAVPARDSQQILISWNAGEVRKPTPYLHVRVEQRDDAGECLALETISLVWRSGDRPMHFLVNLTAGTRNFRLFLQNESCEGFKVADELKIRFLDTTESGPHPLGSIGLISAAASQVAALLRDMVRHYDHYLTSAQRHAVQWREAHHSRRSIETFQRNTPPITEQSEREFVKRLTNSARPSQSERINPPHPEQPESETMEKLTVMIPCCNEERTIGACIESVLPFADEILIADSGSTDRTIEVVESYPECRLIRHTWNGYCHFKNWALERASHDWVMCLDADERVTPQLAEEICGILNNPPENIAAYSVAFQTYFLGHRVRFSNWNNRSLRLIRRECRFRVCRVHENVDISKEQTGRLENPVLHYSIHSYDQFFEKYSRYSKLAAEDLYTIGRRASVWSILVRPFLRFFHLYVIRGGFLDGLVGIQISMFMSFYYSFAKQARLWEMENAIHEPVRSRLSGDSASSNSETLSLQGTRADSAAEKKVA